MSTQVDAVFAKLDEDGSGSVSYEELLMAMRGNMNGQRKAVVKEAFATFDVDRSGAVTIEDLECAYCAKRHPDVRAGKTTEEQVLRDMLRRFDLSADGRVSLEEFTQYYAKQVSPSIDNDDHFCMLVRKSWGLEGEDTRDEGPNHWQKQR